MTQKGLFMHAWAYAWSHAHQCGTQVLALQIIHDGNCQDSHWYITKALFGWVFGFGFWPQKLKTRPKRLFLEGAFSEAAAFP